MRFILVFSLLLSVVLSFAQKKSEVYPIAFYNVENLFDTKRDPRIQDDDFTPNGKYQWTKDRYQKKLNNIGYVISQLGHSESHRGVALIGLAEVENRLVLEDLIKTKTLSKNSYRIVHQDSPDARGIDVALLYNPEVFTLGVYKVYPFKMPGKKTYVKTRDILVVSGTLAGEPLAVLVNHWPSRRGDDAEPLRQRAAAICKHISDSIYKANPRAAIVIMGDMNDDPKDKSTAIVLLAKKNSEDVKVGGLYNTLWKTHNTGIGSLRYQGQWNLFDQIIISESLLSKGKSQLDYIKAEVFNKKFLIQQSGNYKGYPLRTFSGTTFLNGYSDHFPTLIYLRKK
ncbi:MAG: hypothetical protein RL662_1705 [Bacteroidota bacterium]|jgi:predicted extracellular nuclease